MKLELDKFGIMLEYLEEYDQFITEILEIIYKTSYNDELVDCISKYSKVRDKFGSIVIENLGKELQEDA